MSDKSRVEKKFKYFPEDTIRKILERTESRRDRALFLYMINTGLRVSDVVNTQTKNIDWQKCQTFTWDKKKDIWRVVVWPKTIKKDLQEYIKFRTDEDPRLFPITERTVHRTIRKLAESVDFKFAGHVGPHWTRHTFIRLSRKAGRHPEVVADNTGDTLSTIRRWYDVLALSEEEIREEIEKPIY